MPLEIQETVALAPLITLGVGGPARFFAKAQSQADVEEAAAFVRAHNLPLFVLGGGSNVLISDRGWNGLVLQVAIGGVDENGSGNKSTFDVGAGVEWDEFVARAVSLNCAGVECLSGIPGSVGGTPVQNVGAYGQEVAEAMVSVRVFDLGQNQIREMCAAECGFSYRSSVFNTSERGRYIILRVRYELKRDGKPLLSYTDLQKYFAGRAMKPTLGETREAVRTIRASKGMLIIPGDPDSKSAGSFFKNPVMSAEEHARLVQSAHARGLSIPSYPALSQQHKVSAAWLVENSGFPKGYRKGRAAISRKHALAIVNRGGATAAEIAALCEEIRSQVEEKWGIRLETEPVFVGF
jgi:UDP-N-acetylmuramate dehydrogenase